MCGDKIRAYLNKIRCFLSCSLMLLIDRVRVRVRVNNDNVLILLNLWSAFNKLLIPWHGPLPAHPLAIISTHRDSGRLLLNDLIGVKLSWKTDSDLQKKLILNPLVLLFSTWGVNKNISREAQSCHIRILVWCLLSQDDNEAIIWLKASMWYLAHDGKLSPSRHI